MTNDSYETRLLLWQAQGLRLTAFHSQTFPIEIETWWSDLLGQIPESRIARPKERIEEVSGLLPNAEITSAALKLRSQPSRIDWIAEPAEQPLPPQTDLSHLGRFAVALPVFVDLLRPWLGSLPFSLTRLALGGTLLIPAHSRERGYDILAGFLPFPLDPQSTDLLYRINRPVSSTSLGDGTLINRLSTWAVLQIGIIEITLTPGVSQIEPIQAPQEPSFACRLDLDINTAPTRSAPLPSDKYDDLLTEFSQIAVSLAERGDR